MPDLTPFQYATALAIEALDRGEEAEFPVCRTCRRWAPFSNGWLGQCVLPPEPNDDRIGIEFEWDGDNCREEVRVNTHAEYGCVLWEAKQDD